MYFASLFKKTKTLSLYVNIFVNILKKKNLISLCKYKKTLSLYVNILHLYMHILYPYINILSLCTNQQTHHIVSLYEYCPSL